VAKYFWANSLRNALHYKLAKKMKFGENPRFLVFLLAKFGEITPPLNFHLATKLAKTGPRFFLFARKFISISPNLAKSPTKKNPAAAHIQAPPTLGRVECSTQVGPMAN
jgi:hypothetical protein